jgi:hypothetical protein
MTEIPVSGIGTTSLPVMMWSRQLVATLRVAYYQQRERVMNREYLEAKIDLCLDLAEKDLKQEEIARAIKNLQRANSALSQLFGFEEENNE